MATRHSHRYWTTLLILGLLLCMVPRQTQAGSYGGEVIWSEDFEAGWGDWWSDAGIWDVGTPSSGPNGAYSGSQCAATVLDGKYPYGPDSRLIGPNIQLPEVASDEELLLRFRQWWSYESSDRGYVQIQTFDETTGTWPSGWTTLKEVYSYDGTWHQARVDLTEYAGKWIRIGFHHSDETEDSSGIVHHYEGLGWYIDAVEIVRQVVPQFSGTQDFESGWRGWWCDRGIWEIGTPAGGPGSGYDSNQCIATILAGNYPYGPDSRLVSPQIQLPDATLGEELLLQFRQQWSYESVDHGYVQIQSFDEVAGIWSGWFNLKEVHSYDSTWHHARVELTDYAGQRIRIAFYHTDNTEDPSGIVHHAEGLGWYIDNVEVVKQPIPQFCGFEDFELGWDGWWCDCGIWEVGAPSNGPEEAYSGTLCAGTKLGTNYPYGPDSTLISPPIQLPQVSPPGEILLRFRQWWSYAPSDKGRVMIRTYDESTGTWSGWNELYEIKGSNTTSWHHARVVLTDYAGQRAAIAFSHTDETEDPSGIVHHYEGSGWYIDDVEIVPTPLCGTSLDISSTEGGSVTSPGEGAMPCSYGEVVCLTIEAEPGYQFARWEGTAVDAGKLSPSEIDPEACVTVDGNYTLKAIFEPSCMAVYEFPMDSSPGWTLDGQWEFGTPTGQRCGAWGNNDPTGGCTGSSVLGVNLDGCYEPGIGGPYHVTAGPFDMTGYEDVTLKFCRWLNCDIPEYVRCTVEVSTDGQNWTVIWTPAEREEITDTEWTLCEYAIPEADCQPMVYVRWGYEIIQERAYAYTGWNIDDVQLIGCIGCGQ